MKKSHLQSDCLKDLHPVSLLVFFLSASGISMFSGNPVILFISATESLVCHRILKGRRDFISHFKLMLLLSILTALINPLFNHRGRTVLARFPNGNALTLEAVFYGFYAALIVISVLGWFSCFNHVFDSDKLQYVFGRISPALSMVISMTLHFIPEFRAKAREISDANRGIAGEQKGFIKKLKSRLNNFGALITWSLEGSVKKARSMSDRGYGSSKRSMYSIFRLRSRDVAFLGISIFLLLMYILLDIRGAFEFWFYPLVYCRISAGLFAGGMIMLLLGALPVIFNFRGAGRRVRKNVKGVRISENTGI